jgi:CubicO group peptidase (beta-lactamase class C family)
MRRSVAAFLLILSIALTHLARPSDKIDEYIDGEMQRQHIPGLALLVIRDGQIVKAKGFGYANVELKVPVTPETIFQSGSMGKQFASSAAMLLVEEGKLNLDDRISKYLDGTPESWKDITIRNLLSHTSGIKNYNQKDLNFRLDYTEDELLKKAESFPLDFPPGTEWRYSNTGYQVLGILIGKVAGKFYGDLLQEKIFKPLGMNSTRIISEADIIPNRAAGYNLINGELKNQQYVSPSLNTVAEGSLYFNILDLAKWDAALYTDKILSRASLDQMWTVAKLNDGTPNPAKYGFGWVIISLAGHKVIEHGGAWQGFRSNISRYVDDKMTVVVLANLSRADPVAISHHVAGLYIPAIMPVEPAR